MNAETKHTPVPWTKQGTRIQYQKNAGGYRFDIAEVFRDVGAKCAESNADFICRAVNSHADLLEACKALQKRMRDAFADHKADWTELDSAAYEQASKAIEKAEVL